MENSEQVLVYSFLAFLIVLLMVTTKRGFSAIANNFADKEFKYDFDKNRIPVCLAAIAGLVILSFLYGLVVSRDVILAGQFCFGISAFGAVGCVMKICYVRK